jgi:hypothetical protein
MVMTWVMIMVVVMMRGSMRHFRQLVSHADIRLGCLDATTVNPVNIQPCAEAQSL